MTYPTALATVRRNETAGDVELVIIADNGDMVHADTYRDMGAALNAALMIPTHSIRFTDAS